MENLKKEIQNILALFNSRKLKDSEILAKKLVSQNPNIPFLYNLTGLILSEQKKLNEAIKWYEKGLKIQPNYAMIYNNLGSIYKSKDNYKKAETYYKKSISLDSKIAEPENNLAILYRLLNRYDDAIKHFKNAININNNFFFSYYNLGTLYKSIGEFDNARKYLKRSLEINPNFYSSHRTLGQITKYNNKKESNFTELEKAYRNSKSKNAEILFALGKAYEDIKDYDNSFKYYEEGNNLHKKKINFSIIAEKNEFDHIKKTFNNKYINQFKNIQKSTTTPIFIVGMPRSGTTLIEQILSSHPSVFGGDELNFLPNLIKEKFFYKNTILFNKDKFADANEKFSFIGDNYIKNIKNLSKNSPKVTDKLPINFKWIGIIKIILPNAKIINCIRNPKDNCFSIYKNFFSSNELNFAYSLKDIVEFYNLYHDIMNHWKNLSSDFIIDIKYENLIKNTKIEIRKLLNSCNLKWNNKCLNFYNNKRPIKTASDTQVRKKIYKDSINYWKNYEQYLKSNFQKLNI